MTHAHFLQMRGFKLCASVVEKNVFADKNDGYQCQTHGIDIWEVPLQHLMLNYLLEKGKISFPEVSEEEINDRSKGDILSKGIALLQISWFIVQLIARTRQHLTITEIELTTAALAGLNSIMYLFWWSKPLDVRCPIAIRTKELERLLVAKKGQAEMEEDKWTFAFNSQGRYVVEDFRLWAFRKSHCKPLTINPANLARGFRDYVHMTFISLSHSLLSGIRATCNAVLKMLQNSNNRDSGTLSACHQAFKWILTFCRRLAIRLFYLPYVLMFLPMESILNPVYIHEIRGFRDAKDKLHSKSVLEMLFDLEDMEWIIRTIFHYDSAYIKGRPILIFSALIGAGFGSIHCAAWHFDFPSPVERILWQAASLSIVGICLCIITGIPLYNYVLAKWPVFPSNGFEDNFWEACATSLQAFPAIVYSISRITLLILSLLSLRRLPPSALETVTWTKFIPHV